MTGYVSITLCVGCGIEKEIRPYVQTGWWHLKDYKGFSGSHCPKCYDKISQLTDEEAQIVSATIKTLLQNS